MAAVVGRKVMQPGCRTSFIQNDVMNSAVANEDRYPKDVQRRTRGKRERMLIREEKESAWYQNGEMKMKSIIKEKIYNLGESIDFYR